MEPFPVTQIVWQVVILLITAVAIGGVERVLILAGHTEKVWKPAVVRLVGYLGFMFLSLVRWTPGQAEKWIVVLAAVIWLVVEAAPIVIDAKLTILGRWVTAICVIIGFSIVGYFIPMALGIPESIATPLWKICIGAVLLALSTTTLDLIPCIGAGPLDITFIPNCLIRGALAWVGAWILAIPSVFPLVRTAINLS